MSNDRKIYLAANNCCLGYQANRSFTDTTGCIIDELRPNHAGMSTRPIINQKTVAIRARHYKSGEALT